MMEAIGQILERISRLESALAQTVRVGRVVELIPERAMVRVKLPDADERGSELVSYELPVLTQKAEKDKSYWMPDLDEQVLCIFLPFGLGQGFVVNAFYSEADTVPLSNNDIKHFVFKDGSWFQYDRAEHKLSGHVVNGYADLTVDIDAELTVGQDLTATIGRDVTATVGKDLTAEIGNDASLTVKNDLSAKVENNATLTVTNDLKATAKNAYVEAEETTEIKAGELLKQIAPQIKQTGNISYEGENGEIGYESKRADTEHTGSYYLDGNSIIVGHLHVTELTVDVPIHGTLED